jgi:hypothetical protein
MAPQRQPCRERDWGGPIGGQERWGINGREIFRKVGKIEQTFCLWHPKFDEAAPSSSRQTGWPQPERLGHPQLGGAISLATDRFSLVDQSAPFDQALDGFLELARLNSMDEMQC